jgi:hypothetical protein
MFYAMLVYTYISYLVLVLVSGAVDKIYRLVST